MTDASAVAGTYRNRGLAWVRQAGEVLPRRGRYLQGRYLFFGEREEIALGRAGGESILSIAGRLGRSPSTISRELARNSDGRGAYRATTAHPLAYERASRPKPAKLVTNMALRAPSSRTWRRSTHPSRSLAHFEVTTPMTRRCGCPPNHLSALYVQSRGALRRELAECPAHRARATPTQPPGRAP